MASAIIYKGQTLATADNDTKTLLTAGKYLEDNIKVADTRLALKPFILRPDAELVKTWSIDRMVVEDDEATLPAYSTSAQTVLEAAAMTPTYTISYADWDWYVVERMLTIPTYSTTSKAKGRVEYHFSSYLFEITNVPGNTFHSLVEPTLNYTSRLVIIPSQACIRQLYYSGATTLAMYTATTYGCAQVVSAPSIASGVLTINAPSVQERGSTTYFVNTFMNAVTDIRRQFVAELWRAPKGNLNIDAWGHTQQMFHIADCINNHNCKLS